MNKKQLQAKKIVSDAVGTFSKAIDEVNKANAILAQAADADEKELIRLEESIHLAYQRMDVVQAAKMEKVGEMLKNDELVGRLSEFTGVRS